LCGVVATRTLLVCCIVVGATDTLCREEGAEEAFFGNAAVVVEVDPLRLEEPPLPRQLLALGLAREAREPPVRADDPMSRNDQCRVDRRRRREPDASSQYS